MGSGVCDRLSELGLPAVGVNVSESPAMKSQYINLRAELWWKLKPFLEARDCSIPNNEKLISEMVSIKYKFNSSGKAQAESKSEMKKRGCVCGTRKPGVMYTPQHELIGLSNGVNHRDRAMMDVCGAVCGTRRQLHKIEQ